MTLITQWVMQITIFILIATIIELVIPHNAMKKYVNLVIGLILVLIFAQPIFHLFSVDIHSKIGELETILFTEEENHHKTKFLFENQKKDIQAEQDAYILSKVKDQLIDEAKSVLSDAYSVKINQIDFYFYDKHLDMYDDLKEITVYLQSTKDRSYTDTSIDPIIIEMDERVEKDTELTKELQTIQESLKDIWDLQDKKITIIWEGHLD